MNVRKTLGLTFGSTFGFLILLIIFATWRESQIGPAERLQFSKIYIDAFSVIVVSFFVGLLGILIPARLREVQHDFERLKESRVAYSEAKTGVAYLPLRLCSMNFNDAAAFIQQVHFHKHQAQLYRELESHVRPDWRTAAAWADEMYAFLGAFRETLEKHAADWDALDRGDRMRLLLDARAAVARRFPDEESGEQHLRAKAPGASPMPRPTAAAPPDRRAREKEFAKHERNRSSHPVQDDPIQGGENR